MGACCTLLAAAQLTVFAGLVAAGRVPGPGAKLRAAAPWTSVSFNFAGGRRSFARRSSTGRGRTSSLPPIRAPCARSPAPARPGAAGVRPERAGDRGPGGKSGRDPFAGRPPPRPAAGGRRARSAESVSIRSGSWRRLRAATVQPLAPRSSRGSRHGSSNVRQVLAKVALGEADAAIVYRTDAMASRGAVEVISIPPELNVVAEYPTRGASRRATSRVGGRIRRVWCCRRPGRRCWRDMGSSEAPPPGTPPSLPPSACWPRSSSFPSPRWA